MKASLPVVNERESEMAGQWAAGLRGPLRLEDGRMLRVVFPGLPGRGPGPDYRDALFEIGDDLVRGDVEFHLLASGWRTYGHVHDEAYDAVALHVVRANDTPALISTTSSGRSVPLLLLVARGRQGGVSTPPLTPPCVFAHRQGFDIPATLERLSRRRLRMKCARIAPFVRERGAGPALYLLLLERCADDSDGSSSTRSRRFAAELRGLAAGLALRRAGLRPMASPGKRLDVAGALFAWLWPAEAMPTWPSRLIPGVLLPSVPGLGGSTSTELLLNAVLPVAMASGAWPVEGVEAA